VGLHDGAGLTPGDVGANRPQIQTTGSEEVHMDNDSDFVGGYAVPVDPMDDLQCDSCQ
jgi:hypothetical protein